MLRRALTWPRGPAASPGALTQAEFRAAVASAGFDQLEIRDTHRVHEHAASGIIRARKR